MWSSSSKQEKYNNIAPHLVSRMSAFWGWELNSFFFVFTNFYLVWENKVVLFSSTELKISNLHFCEPQWNFSVFMHSPPFLLPLCLSSSIFFSFIARSYKIDKKLHFPFSFMAMHLMKYFPFKLMWMDVAEWKFIGSLCIHA